MADWLYNLSKTDNNIKVNIRVDSDFAFKYSCRNGHKEVAEYLVSLCPDYKLVIENNEIKSYKIIKLKDRIKDKTDDEIIDMLKIKKEIKQNQSNFVNVDNKCYICLGDPNLKYGCNHWTCLNCMIQWNINENKNICDLCKKPIEFNEMIYFI